MLNKIKILLLFNFLLSTAINAQEVISHPKQKYVASDGTLYWPGSLPMYVFVADNPEGTDTKRLESKTSPNHSNPLYLDTEGINFIRKKWAVNSEGQYAKPQQEILFEFYRDSKPPTSSLTIEGGSPFLIDGKRYYGLNLTFSLAAKDQYSGVNTIYTSINGSPFIQFDKPLKLEENGNYELKYYSVDNVGNQEEVKSYSFVVDVSAPTTLLTVKGERLQNILSPSTTLILTSEDEISKIKEIRYSIDDQDERQYKNNLSFSKLEDGDHTISYYAIDNTGNVEEAKSYSFYLDKTAPEVKSTIVGDQYQSRGRVFVSTRSKVKLEATDNKSGVKKIYYTINGGSEKTYDAPFDLPKSKGNYEIRFFASDKMGNTFETVFDETKHGRQALDLDMEVPEIDFSYSGNEHFARDTTFITSETKIQISANDDDSGINSIGYKINGGKGELYTDGFSLPNEGTYMIDYFATDNVNNRNIDQFTFIIDNTGPSIETIWSMSQVGTMLLDDGLGSTPVYSSGVKLYLASTDNLLDTESIFYTINNDPEKVYSLPIVISSKGMNNILVRATDKLGNESVKEVIQVYIK